MKNTLKWQKGKNYFYLFLSSIIFGSAISSYAQDDWPAVGTEWYYTYSPCDISYCPGIKEYIYLKVVKDTTLNETLCKKIDVFYHKSDKSKSYLGSEYVFSKNDSVFNFHHGGFNLLYNFDVSIGDTVELYLGSNTNVYLLNNAEPEYLKTIHIVTTVDSVEYNQTKFKYVSYSSVESFNTKPVLNGVIVKGIGSMNYLTGKLVSPIEVNYYGPLRCFNTTHLSYKNLQEGAVCDTIITSANQINSFENKKVVVYPNPSEQSVYIKVFNDRLECIYVYDTLGKICYFESQIHSDSNAYNISDLDPGMYVLRITTKSGEVFTKSILKK